MALQCFAEQSPHCTARAALHYVDISPVVIMVMLQNLYSKNVGSWLLNALRTCSHLLCLCIVHSYGICKNADYLDLSDLNPVLNAMEGQKTLKIM